VLDSHVAIDLVVDGEPVQAAARDEIRETQRLAVTGARVVGYQRVLAGDTPELLQLRG
jgi:hypothetical protein